MANTEYDDLKEELPGGTLAKERIESRFGQDPVSASHYLRGLMEQNFRECEQNRPSEWIDSRGNNVFDLENNYHLNLLRNLCDGVNSEAIVSPSQRAFLLRAIGLPDWKFLADSAEMSAYIQKYQSRDPWEDSISIATYLNTCNG